ncbi:MAG: class I SAM-dependent methyltransferase [Patescibacteria group bacterium]
MLSNKSRACPICSCLEKVLLFRQKFSDKTIFLMDGYDVVVCDKCGFVFADGIPLQADFDGYYAAMSKYEFSYQGGRVSKEYVDYFTKIFNFLAPRVQNKNAKILDIGCSTGSLLSIFKLNGYSNIFGIDPSSECSKTAKELYDITVTTDTVYNFNSIEKFDLIILSAVLEHLVDFDYSMQKIRSLLNENGLLFIAVPNAEKFSLFVSAPFQQFSTEHINYFSRYSIKNLLSRFSFEEIAVRQDEHKLNNAVDTEILSLSKKTAEETLKIVRDDISEPRVREYITKCLAMDLTLNQIIQEKLSGKDKIIIWGVGTHTQRLIGSGLDLSKILFFVDSNKRYAGKKIKGLEVKPPEAIKEGVPVFISSHSYQEEIIHQIREVLKLNNEIITLY